MHAQRPIRRLVVAIALLAPAALVAQQPAPPMAPSAPPAAPLPSVTLPPELDRVLRDYERGWAGGDAAALAALFAEDGFVLQGNRPPVRGRAAIERAYTGQGGDPLRLRALAWATADTVGYIVGAYGYDEARGDVGKFTLTLRRAPGGRWLIFSDMDNSSVPPRRPGAPTPPAAPPP